MIINGLLIIAGVVLVLWGADRLVEGASAVARSVNIPEIVIGLTIVAAGTSAPELFVSLISALKGTPDLAVGNVIGSNIFNTMLIVGCSALVAPMVVNPSTVKKDIPFAVVASMLLFILCFDDMQSVNYKMLGINSIWMIVGLACLIFGSDLFVNGATYIAHRYGVRQSVIGLTIVAGGTSLPELATSVVAAYKGKASLAIGNALGSNVFNIFLVLGVTAVICPMRIMGITIIDLMMMLVSIGILWIFAYTKYFVSRREGFLMVLGFLGYMCWLFYLL